MLLDNTTYKRLSACVKTTARLAADRYDMDHMIVDEVRHVHMLKNKNSNQA